MDYTRFDLKIHNENSSMNNELIGYIDVENFQLSASTLYYIIMLKNNGSLIVRDYYITFDRILSDKPQTRITLNIIP